MDGKSGDAYERAPATACEGCARLTAAPAAEGHAGLVQLCAPVEAGWLIWCCQRCSVVFVQTWQKDRAGLLVRCDPSAKDPCDQDSSPENRAVSSR